MVIVLCFLIVIFFSSRRRHTSFDCDWSSDVCSSDLLYHARAPLAYALVGQTRDDAAGEAFDKVAKLLGLGFPGGPAIERAAKTGDPKAVTFPLAQMTDRASGFSFSGLKTSASLHVKRHAPPGEGQVADIAASFSAAVAEML